jgi:PPOX class probable F420-dependent enzyme
MKMAELPEKARDLFEKPVIAGLVTIMPNGQPQATPVWVDYDGQYVRINTARGRQKDRNMTKQSKVTLLLVDPSNPYHWVEVRGHVEDVTEEGANDHINQLSHKYTGRDYQGFKSDEQRVTYKIEPDKVNAR